MKQKSVVITCPNCGAEYLPAEIYLPDYFLGKPSNIDKDGNGKLIYFSGDNMNLSETYHCDYCKKEFKIICKLNFITDYNRDLDFDEEYSTQMSKKRGLFLLEEE